VRAIIEPDSESFATPDPTGNGMLHSQCNRKAVDLRTVVVPQGADGISIELIHDTCLLNFIKH